MPRSTENVLVRMNIVPQYLDDVFYLPPEKRNKKTYNPRVATVARTITDEVHQKMYREKQESKAKKRKRKVRQKTSSGEEAGDKVKSRKQQENKETARKKERKRRIY